jgi:hypothetical protein
VGIHDAMFRRLMKNSRTAHALLRERLPRSLRRYLTQPPEQISETFVRGPLRRRTADVVFRARLEGLHRELCLFCIVEHKRESAPDVLLQLLDYVVSRYRELLHARKKRGEKLPLVVGMIVYNGTTPWNAARQLREMLEIPRGAESLAVDFAPIIIDLHSESVERLAVDASLKYALLTLKAAAVPAKQLDAVLWRLLRETRGDDQSRGLSLGYLTHALGREARQVLETTAMRYKDTEEPTMKTIHQYYMDQKRKAVERALRKAVKRVVTTRFGAMPSKLQTALDKATAPSLEKWLDKAATASSLTALTAR